jgi:stress response protein YsnF
MLADQLIARESRMPSTPDRGEPVLRLHAEDVTVSRRTVAGDTLRVGTITRRRDHHIDENLSHVRVEVERVLIGRPVAAVPPTREEGDTTILSVVEEIIVVERRLILKEEVHIRRVHVAERHQETVVVREQSVEISRAEAASPALGDDRHPLAAAAIPILQEQK